MHSTNKIRTSKVCLPKVIELFKLHLLLWNRINLLTVIKNCWIENSYIARSMIIFSSTPKLLYLFLSLVKLLVPIIAKRYSLVHEINICCTKLLFKRNWFTHFQNDVTELMNYVRVIKLEHLVAFSLQ